MGFRTIAVGGLVPLKTPEIMAVLEAIAAVRKPETNTTETPTERILEEQPWKKCPCDICKRIGIHVMLFRGAERNRRRGFHNVHVLYRRMRRELSRVC